MPGCKSKSLQDPVIPFLAVQHGFYKKVQHKSNNTRAQHEDGDHDDRHERNIYGGGAVHYRENINCCIDITAKFFTDLCVKGVNICPVRNIDIIAFILQPAHAFIAAAGEQAVFAQIIGNLRESGDQISGLISICGQRDLVSDLQIMLPCVFGGNGHLIVVFRKTSVKADVLIIHIRKIIGNCCH